MGECVGGWVGQWVGSGQMTNQLYKSWPNRDNSILFEDSWFVETPHPHPHPLVDGWVGQWMGLGQMINNWINLDPIEIIQFCLKTYDL